MYSDKKHHDGSKVSFEKALDMAGFGMYSYIMLCLAGFIIISYACISFGTTVIIPASACELNTTNSQQGYLAAGPLFGIILGAAVGGYFGDKYGRRRVLLISLLSSATVNGIASISVNWVMLLILQSIAAFCSSGKYSLAMSIVSESVPTAKRNIVILLVSSIFLLSQGVMAVIAIPIIPLPFSNYLPALGIYWNSWRTLLLVYSTPSLLSALVLFFMKESPKYMFAQGRDEEAVEIIKAIHKMNNGKSSGELQITGLLKEVQLTGEPATVLSPILLFKMPLLKYILIITSLFVLQQIGAFLMWLPTIANQFIQIIETGVGTDRSLCAIINDSLDAPPDPNIAPCALNVVALLIVLLVCVTQSIANGLISLVVNQAGRRNMAMGAAVICGLSGVLVNVVPNAYGSTVLFVVYLLGIVVSGLYTAIAVALFPTQLRALAIAITMTGGRLSTLAAVQILNLLLETNCDAGFYIFCSIFASSALVAAFLPDDRRLKPPPTKATKEAYRSANSD